MSKMYMGSASTVIVLLCRLAIGVVGLYWLSLYDWLRFTVAVVALLLSLLPVLLIRDLLLRNVTTVLTAILLASHIVVGMQAGLYETSILYDKVVHVLGSSAVAAILLITIQRYCGRLRIKLPLVLVAVLVLGGTLSVGVLWEIFEYAIDTTGLFRSQRGLHDTMIDLIADALGAILTALTFVAIVCVRNKYGSTSRLLPDTSS